MINVGKRLNSLTSHNYNQCCMFTSQADKRISTQNIQDIYKHDKRQLYI